MNNILMLFIFVPILALILLFLNLLLAPHVPYEAKVSAYECGYQAIPGQTRSTFHVHFFIVCLLFLIFDLEILLLFPLAVSLYHVSVFGFVMGLIFFIVLTIGFVLEIGSGAINITTSKNENKVNPLRPNIYLTHILKDGEEKHIKMLFNKPIYKIAYLKFNNYLLPLTMNPQDYGKIRVPDTYIKDIGKTRYVVQNENTIFFIESTRLYNQIRIAGPADIKWTDWKINDNSFKRIIGKNTLYIKDGAIVAKEKQLNAKPLKAVKFDTGLSTKNFICIDIKTVTINKVINRYLICGYSKDIFIYSYAKDVSYKSQEVMIKNFISQILELNDIDTIYAYNLSNLDGIFYLNI